MPLNSKNLNRRVFVQATALLATASLLPKGLFAAAKAFPANAATYKVLTCNIRVALPDDDKAGVGWSARRQFCAEVIRKQKADIIGMQEVLRVQNQDLKKLLPEYASIGFEGPEMDAFKDEAYHGIAKNPIFYLKSRFELLGAGQYWLSETPLIGGSQSWDTARARNANWVRLLDKKTGKDFRVVNLHLDHKIQPAREQQIRVVMNEMKQYPADYPQILTGDFNSGMNNGVYQIICDNGFADTYTAINGDTEPGRTAHEFKGDGAAAKGHKIDFIFVKSGFEPKAASIIKDSKDGHYPSDHYFVSAVIAG